MGGPGARVDREPGQVRKEAAISVFRPVPPVARPWSGRRGWEGLWHAAGSNTAIPDTDPDGVLHAALPKSLSNLHRHRVDEPLFPHVHPLGHLAVWAFGGIGDIAVGHCG